MKAIHLKLRAVQSVERRHPWIFSGGIHKIEGSPGPGDTVALFAPRRRMLGRGAFSPNSRLAVRIWSFSPDMGIDPAFFRNRIDRAVACRESLPDFAGTARRLINSEADGLPGVVADQYGGRLVCQFLTTGAEKWKSLIADLLAERTGIPRIYERSDVNIRKKEGLVPAAGPLRGEAPSGPVEIMEAGRRYLVDIITGHKTGFYLDQRENRSAVEKFAENAEVLNCFAYTGGFGIAALRGGAASVTDVEASVPALELAERNRKLNGLPAERYTAERGDVFQVLRRYRDQGRKFDLIVLDPPKFVDARFQLERAGRGYKDINLLAFKLLRPGGRLFTFSCSGLVTPGLFHKIVADAAADARKDVRILGRLGQAPDHPSAPGFPEGHYLKGLICTL